MTTAERRMFAKTIIDSDAFLDMPLSTQALYFHLSMRADDDGFVNNPKRIQRMIGASDDDLKVLIAKSFVLIFESGVIVIKHWRINNYIQKDRKKDTEYQEEYDLLEVKKNGAYTLCIQNGYNLDTQVSIGKDSIDKDSIYNPPYIPPTTPKKSKSAINVDIFKMLDDSDLNEDVKASVTDWLTYKAEQFKFSYKPTGFKAFLTEIHNNELTLGTENVCKAISLSMGKGYKGIIWDLVKKEQPKSSAYMDAIKNRVNVVDSWT